MTRTAAIMAALALPVALAAQEHGEARRAKQAYDQLDFRTAIATAQRALRQRLSRDDRIAVYELLGFAYGALDSTRQAVDAFKQLIFLDPNREPDVEQVSPRITSLYASALGQVLVVRRLTVDTASFVAGQGGVPIRFQLSRSARAVTRVVGQGLNLVVDSQLVSGATRVEWRGLTPEGDAVPPGRYQIIVTAVEGGNEFAAPVEVEVVHGPVDTIAHLTSLPGYAEQPEFVSPPRNWRPLGLSVLFAGVTAGASLALENTILGGGERREIGGVAVLTLAVGLILSLKQPDLQPVQANIRYNKLLREQVAARNTEIASRNDLRRRQVMLTVTPVRGSP
ncbi:MAG: hypothetical protein V3T28_06360 [Gemmatimonadales bacterium]